MTDAKTMEAAIARIVVEQLSPLAPLQAPDTGRLHDPRYNGIREAILKAEQHMRTLITGGEEEVHEWLAVIHYALADERERLLG